MAKSGPQLMRLHSVKLDPSGFWGKRLAQVCDEIIFYQWKALNDEVPGAPKSHALENLRIAAGLRQGEFYGYVFQDSDVAKWLEAASYCLALRPNKELKVLVDEAVEIIAKAQQSDGYINSYFTIKEPHMRWKNLRDNHELYCAGHLIEAGVAHHLATGEEKLLEVVRRLADHIYIIFGPAPGKKRGYCGHPEIELALVKLYKVTKDNRYLHLSKFFIDQRGQKPLYFEVEAWERGEEKPRWPFWSPEYCQAHLPVREQKEAVGHAVRAMYLYSAMADIARLMHDSELTEACKFLWDSVTERRMYITGGVGAEAHGEAFSFDYDLPNDRAYAETCASIGLVFWAYRMFQLDPDRRYIDTLERALYNGVLSGISLDGTKYFYTNPLEVWPKACQNRHDLRHVLFQRQPWFDCACCPPNIARLLASISQYIYTQINDIIYVHLFAAGKATFALPGGPVTVIQETDYPWDGVVNVSVRLKTPLSFTLAIRIPGWSREPKVCVNGEEWDLSSVLEKGYAKIRRTWRNGDTVRLILPMPIERVRAHPEVRACAGKVAILRGPLVYCVEEADNGPNLTQLVLPKEAELVVAGASPDLGGAVVLEGTALRIDSSAWGNALYSCNEHSLEPRRIKFIPYYAWANRIPGEMTVWIREG